MIYIVDDIIEKDLFQLATDYLNEGEFEKVESGGKDFYIKESPESFTEHILSKLQARVSYLFSVRLRMSWMLHGVSIRT
jgi:hypothetical protein